MRSITALTALAVTSVTLSAQTPPPKLPPTLEAAVIERVNGHMTKGMVIGIIDERGQRFMSYGTDGRGRPVDENTVFEIGSISKVFTTTMLAEQLLEGKLRLDDPIDRVLPVTTTAPSRSGKRITFRQLATHRSGLPRVPFNLDVTRENPYSGYEEPQLLNFLSTWSLERDPDKKEEYSNLGVGLLGYLLARVDSTSYEEMMLARVAKPLGLTSTRIRLTPELDARFAQGHSMVGRAVGPWDLGVLAGAGGIRSTAADMLRFVAANIGLIDTPLRAAMDLAQERQDKKAGKGDGIALAWQIAERKTGEYYWHNGATAGFHSFIAFDKKRKVGVVVLSNSLNAVEDIGSLALDEKTRLLESWLPHERLAIDIGGGEGQASSAAAMSVRASYLMYIDNFRLLQLKPFVGFTQNALAARTATASGSPTIAGDAIEVGGWLQNGSFLSFLLGHLPFLPFHDISLGTGIKLDYSPDATRHRLTASSTVLPQWSWQRGENIQLRRGKYAFTLESWRAVRPLGEDRREIKSRLISKEQVRVGVSRLF